MGQYEAMMTEAEELRALGRRACDHNESRRLMKQAARIERKARELTVAEGEAQK